MSSLNPTVIATAVVDYAITTPAERRAIASFRPRYEAEYDRLARIHMLKHEICPMIFTYWRQNNLDPPDHTSFLKKIKKKKFSQAISHYVRNNWRRPRPLKVNGKGEVKVRIHDLVWETMSDKVEERIKDILKSDAPISRNDPAFLKHLNTAISDVRNAISPTELAQLQTIKAMRMKMGLPTEKQQRIYEKDGDMRVKKAASSNWLEMGMLQLTFGAVMNKQGQWVMEVHEHAAEHMGVIAKPFRKLWPKEIDDIESKFLQYIRHLNDLKHPNQPATEPNMMRRPDLQVVTSPGAPPIMPPPPAPNVHQKTKELERILRVYLNDHYKLASGYQNMTAPYKEIAKCPSKFIDNEYLPPGFVFKDPTDMRREELLQFIEHLRTLEDNFRFKAYLADRRGGGASEANLAPARYDCSHLEAKTKTIAEQQQTRRKKKKQAKTKTPITDPVIDEENLEMRLWNDPAGENADAILDGLSITALDPQLAIAPNTGPQLEELNGPPRYEVGADVWKTYSQMEKRTLTTNDGDSVPSPVPDPIAAPPVTVPERSTVPNTTDNSVNVSVGSVPSLATPEPTMVPKASNISAKATTKPKRGRKCEAQHLAAQNAPSTSPSAVHPEPTIPNSSDVPANTSAQGQKRRRRGADNVATEEVANLDVSRSGRVRKPRVHVD
ncbi:hypothetical protein BDN70DRAFT_901363 [Pholiota conissans]|uniref:Uncharacterized protein n=1 Tax=Pholiota conissans TaxID=109636 RepID=A0A9P5YLM0_9AGAR|nr:hypothetical protein BDN70DRAFT_901363 [Pholiota conissans]